MFLLCLKRTLAFVKFIILELTLFFIYCYQSFISQFTTPSCRYCVTCSSYALKMLERYGIYKGALLTIRRILRCNAFMR